MAIKVDEGIEVFDINDYGTWCSFRICHKGVLYSAAYERQADKSILNTSAPKEVCDRVKAYFIGEDIKKKDEAAEQ